MIPGVPGQGYKGFQFIDPEWAQYEFNGSQSVDYGAPNAIDFSATIHEDAPFTRSTATNIDINVDGSYFVFHNHFSDSSGANRYGGGIYCSIDSGFSKDIVPMAMTKTYHRDGGASSESGGTASGLLDMNQGQTLTLVSGNAVNVFSGSCQIEKAGLGLLKLPANADMFKSLDTPESGAPWNAGSFSLPNSFDAPYVDSVLDWRALDLRTPTVIGSSYTHPGGHQSPEVGLAPGVYLVSASTLIWPATSNRTIWLTRYLLDGQLVPYSYGYGYDRGTGARYPVSHNLFLLNAPSGGLLKGEVAKGTEIATTVLTYRSCLVIVKLSDNVDYLKLQPVSDQSIPAADTGWSPLELASKQHITPTWTQNTNDSITFNKTDDYLTIFSGVTERANYNNANRLIATTGQVLSSDLDPVFYSSQGAHYNRGEQAGNFPHGGHATGYMRSINEGDTMSFLHADTGMGNAEAVWDSTRTGLTIIRMSTMFEES